MANEDLVSFRNELKDDFGGVWDDLEAAIASMKQEFSQDDRDAFKECANAGGRADFVDCLDEKASEMGVGAAFRRVILNQEGLISDLREQARSAAESNNVSEAVRAAANYSSLSALNKMCANPNVSDSDIEDELSSASLKVVGGGIDSYQDCVTATAEEENLSSNLRSAYGTA